MEKTFQLEIRSVMLKLHFFILEGKDFISFLSSNFLNFPIQAIENGLSTVQYGARAGARYGA